jgi:hypothetical protein
VHLVYTSCTRLETRYSNSLAYAALSCLFAGVYALTGSGLGGKKALVAFWGAFRPLTAMFPGPMQIESGGAGAELRHIERSDSTPIQVAGR